MTNLSLARIMYGTNEDLHAPHSMRGSGFPSPANQAARENASGSMTHENSLGDLLHKAWYSLSGKH
jgi:hypothetical protein